MFTISRWSGEQIVFTMSFAAMPRADVSSVTVKENFFIILNK
jgi:hypothetical protein